MTPDEQLTLWCDGISKCPNSNNECCPDFSCCNPRLAWPLAQRKAFREAIFLGNHELAEKMLLGTLAAAMADRAVYVAGSESEKKS